MKYQTAGNGKAEKKALGMKIAITLVSAFVLAVLIKLSDYLGGGSARDFFTPKVFTDIAIITALMLGLLATLIAYAYFTKRELFKEKKLFPIIYISLILTYFLCLVFGLLVNLYVVPLMLSGLLVAGLVDRKVGIAVNLLMSQVFFLTYMLVSGGGNIFESASALITSMVAGIFMIAFMDRAETRLKFIGLGLGVGLATAVIPILLNLINAYASIEEALMYGLWSFLSSILAVGLYMLILPVMEYVFKVNTDFRLAEITSLQFPLLKRLAKEAPGTFNHSLVVGNLSELCAAAIGENPQLAKAASYYHDVGKIKNPEYFFENQKGYNPHDDLIPEVSVKMITSHTGDGYNMIKKHRLPDIIADVAREHHGTTPANFFLNKAQSLTEDGIEKSEFSYPDPLPSSKVAAIVMIVDTVEAATRAMSGKITNPKEFREIIHKLIKQKTDLNQFSNCDITFKDLQIIEDTLVDAVPNMYHARIQYAKTDK
ncbi:MAG: HDIG domain-containing metalloprotein [Clostridia bacterium]